MSAAALTILFSLAAASAWGVADFAGGLASRRANVYAVLLAGEAIGLVLLLPLPFLFRETLPPVRDLFFCMLAGLAGIFGLSMLYRAMAAGQMSVAAPVSALLAALVPVLAGALLEGFAGWVQMAGFLLAMAAIWFISSTDESRRSFSLRWSLLRLPLLAGLIFGAYFVLMNLGSQSATFYPVLAARVASIAALLVFSLVRRQPLLPGRRVWLLVAAYGCLDVLANSLYVLAGQSGRLDIAAVIGSLYPGMTVFLAFLILKERISGLQWFGIATALLAIALISL